MTGTRYTLEINPILPARLKRLPELANDLLYSWDRQVRGLFFRLDRELWESCGHNPRCSCDVLPRRAWRMQRTTGCSWRTTTASCPATTPIMANERAPLSRNSSNASR